MYDVLKVEYSGNGQLKVYRDAFDEICDTGQDLIITGSNWMYSGGGFIVCPGIICPLIGLQAQPAKLVTINEQVDNKNTH